MARDDEAVALLNAIVDDAVAAARDQAEAIDMVEADPRLQQISKGALARAFIRGLVLQRAIGMVVGFRGLFRDHKDELGAIRVLNRLDDYPPSADDAAAVTNSEAGAVFLAILERFNVHPGSAETLP